PAAGVGLDIEDGAAVELEREALRGRLDLEGSDRAHDPPPSSPSRTIWRVTSRPFQASPSGSVLQVSCGTGRDKRSLIRWEDVSRLVVTERSRVDRQPTVMTQQPRISIEHDLCRIVPDLSHRRWPGRLERRVFVALDP